MVFFTTHTSQRRAKIALNLPPVNSRVTAKRFGLALALAIISLPIAADESAASTYTVPEINGAIVNQPLPDGLTETVGEALPESRNVDAAFLLPQYTPYAELSQDAQVYVSFVSEGAGFKNSLGFYTFDDTTFQGMSKSSIDLDGSGVVELSEIIATQGVEIGWIFPNSSASGSGGQLNPGDTLALNNDEVFPQGTNIGFFLVQNAWNGTEVNVSESGRETQTFYSHDFLNPEAPQNATDGYYSVEDGSRHTAMLFADTDDTSLILAFEDLNRANRFENNYFISSDEDFNDSVFLVMSTPTIALSGTNVPMAAEPVPIPGSAVLLLSGLGLFSMATKRKKAQKEVSPL